MSLADDLKTEVKRIFRDKWETRDGEVVPDPEDLSLTNEAVHFDRATVLYADLSGSTSLVDKHKWGFAAEIYRSYLFCAAKIIREEGGTITAYDGDRVMGVFVGANQTTPAARCALKINWAVQNVVNVALKEQYPNSDYKVRQVVGIDTSEIRAARTGVRGDNDLVWVGRAANYAAKLTELNADYPTWITSAAFNRLDEVAKLGGSNKELMWKKWTWTGHDGSEIYSSTWTWKVD